jgi:hypothetical protein
MRRFCGRSEGGSTNCTAKRGMDTRWIPREFDSATSADKRSVLRTSSVTVAVVDFQLTRNHESEVASVPDDMGDYG